MTNLKRPKYTPPRTLQELKERVQHYANRLDVRGYDNDAEELRCLVDGDPEVADTDSFGNRFWTEDNPHPYAK